MGSVLTGPSPGGRRRAVLAALDSAEGAPLGFTYWFLGTHQIALAWLYVPGVDREPVP